MSILNFYKLHGLGNDFVLIDLLKQKNIETQRSRDYPLFTENFCKKISDRKTGIGCDQILVLLPSPKKADRKLVIYNADGSSAEMCGNGLRAAALYLSKSKSFTFSRKNKSTIRRKQKCSLFTLETPVGIQKTWVNSKTVTCEMGIPKILPLPKLIKTDAKLNRFLSSSVTDAKLNRFFSAPLVFVNVGNPHLVLFFTKSLFQRVHQQMASLGQYLENHPAFPKRTNVEFVQLVNKHKLNATVWERGVGMTKACGSGAVAIATASIFKKIAISPVQIQFPGGPLKVSWDGLGSNAELTGDAKMVFRGYYSSGP